MKLLFLPLSLSLSYPPARVPAPTIKLKGNFACSQSVLVPGKDILSWYAPTQRECQNGAVVLAYEKRLSRASQEPRYEITGTMQVKLSSAKNFLMIAGCTNATGKSKQYFVSIG
jgi:hypothetical protein